MSLPYDKSRCWGRKAPNGHPVTVCLDCQRRLAAGTGGPRTPYFSPPAERVQGVWTCAEKR